MARVGEEVIEDRLEARPHNNEGCCDDGNIKFDDDYKMGRNDEP
jgi:hypothetical protein